MYTQLWNGEVLKNTAFIEKNSMISAVEIGCFEGLSSNYFADNLLAEHGKLICIDPLEDDYELDCMEGLFKGQYERFVENTKHNDKISLVRERSVDALPSIPNDSQDFVYIDGHHTHPAVYFDGTEAFRICKAYGFILFDDYLWGNNQQLKPAIDSVLSENPNHRLLLKLNQVLIQKLPQGSDTEDGQDEYQDKSIEKLFNKETIYAAYCNLDYRTDRNEKMKTELKRVGVDMVRQRSFFWKDIWDNASEDEKRNIDFMHSIRKTPGAIGCWYSQVAIMKEALRQGKHAWVNEDDLVFCDDIHERLKIAFKFLNTHEWDIFWLGGTYHTEPTWHKSVEGKHTHRDMTMCKCAFNRDYEPTFNPHIVRTFGAFSTHSYIVNKDRIAHILFLLDRDMYFSMGIDFLMILHQPNLYTYAFNPGCVKQYSSQSDIGHGISDQEGFRNLGKHWWSRKMNEYIPD